MSKAKLTALPYHSHSSELFASIAHQPWAIFLDSCHPYSAYGRYDILAAEPYITLVTEGLITTIHEGVKPIIRTTNPFLLLKEYLGDRSPKPFDLPFCGGLLGYFAYDLARYLEEIPTQAASGIAMPEMAVGLYDWAIVVDHLKKQTWLVEAGRYDGIPSSLKKQLCTRTADQPANVKESFQLTSSWESNFTAASYAQAFAAIQHHLYQGDCYQVNLAQRFTASFVGSPWTAFQHLRQLNPAPFASYFKLPQGTILSLSPERFLLMQGDTITTKPIKGTRARSLDPVLDQQMAQELMHSEKDHAENLMIVDLLRNDLSKNSRIGSVKVPSLFALEHFPGVHHLVSTITAQRTSDRHSVDVLIGCFPGGSITGTPKLSAMQIIESLEPQRRSVYCGSIGYISFDGDMDTNIAIRTLICHDDRLYCSAGGGIVIDSELESEYQETFTKVNRLLKGLQDI